MSLSVCGIGLKKEESDRRGQISEWIAAIIRLSSGLKFVGKLGIFLFLGNWKSLPMRLIEFDILIKALAFR